MGFYGRNIFSHGVYGSLNYEKGYVSIPDKELTEKFVLPDTYGWNLVFEEGYGKKA